MAKVRSPSYPAIGLKEAIEKAGAVYKNDYQNQVPRAVAAAHMGYQSLNGKSLGVLSALLKFGLLEGRGDQTRVSDLALRIIAHPAGDPERSAAIIEAASKPELFAELNKRYPAGGGSDAAIRSYLLTQKFIPVAADSALRSYRETKALVAAETEGYTAPDTETVMDSALDIGPTPQPDWSNMKIIDPEPTPGQRRTVFDLSEGEVVITFPEGLSPESVSDLQDYLSVFMKKARREAGVQ
jgi:hypothetical protein